MIWFRNPVMLSLIILQLRMYFRHFDIFYMSDPIQYLDIIVVLVTAQNI